MLMTDFLLVDWRLVFRLMMMHNFLVVMNDHRLFHFLGYVNFWLVNFLLDRLFLLDDGGLVVNVHRFD